MIPKEDIYKLKLDLKKYLNQKTNYSIISLESKLNLLSKDDLFVLICDLFKDSVDNFNFETPVYYNKYLFKCIDYLNRDEIKNKEYIIKKIEKIKKIITDKINNNKSNTNVSISNKAFLLSLNSELNYIIVKLKNEKNNNILNMNDTYDILNELIFKIRNPIYVEEILNNYPNLILTKKNNRYLFEEVYDKYLNVLLNRNDNYELLYFNKLVLTFLKNSNNNEDIKIIVLNKSNKLLSSLDSRNISKEKIAKIKFFLKELNDFYLNPNLTVGKRLENLKIKYNLKKIENLEKFTIKKVNWKNYKENNRYILTFDDPNAKILENAISFDCLKNGNYLLGLYVVDMDAYLDGENNLKEYIYENTMSIKGYPMVPKEITSKLSLEQNKRKKTIAYLFELDRNLCVVNFKVERHNIKVKYNLKFSDVKKIMEYPLDTKLKRKVSQIYNLSKYILNDKEEKEEYHEVKEISKKILYDNEYKEKNKGAKMISNYQIFLNSYIPLYCYQHDLPYLYRNNEFNRSIKLITTLKEKYKHNIDLEDVLSFVYAIYEPSNYSTENKGHAGLNLDAYGEVSKPLRSLASIVNQKLINEYFINGLVLNEEDKKVYINELNKICEQLNKKRILYDNYIYEANKILKKNKK